MIYRGRSSSSWQSLEGHEQFIELDVLHAQRDLRVIVVTGYKIIARPQHIRVVFISFHTFYRLGNLVLQVVEEDTLDFGVKFPKLLLSL